MNKIKNFFSKDFTYVIVGASNNTEKFGFKIVSKLKEKKFNVIPVNKNETQICGIKVFSSLDKINEKIDVVDFVVPPNVTLILLEEIKKLNIKKVWFQPNSYDDNCIKFCKNNKIKFLIGECLYKQTLEYND